MSNFEFLSQVSTDIYNCAKKSEEMTISSPRASILYAQQSLESAIRLIYETDKTLKMTRQKSLSSLIYRDEFKENIPVELFAKLKIILKLGKLLSSSRSKIKKTDSIMAVKCLWAVLRYFTLLYTDVEPNEEFTENFPSSKEAPELSSDEIKSIQDEYSKKDLIVFNQSLPFFTQSQEEQLKSKDDRKKKRQNKFKSFFDNYTEDQTRDLFIDVMLREAGWTSFIDKQDVEFEVTPFPENKTNKGYVDYVLWDDNGLPLALVEAKRTKKDARIGEHQAWLYANALETMFGQRPIMFFSNGYETWIRDDHFYPKRPVNGFYKKEELQWMIQRRSMAKIKLSESIPNLNIAERPYQLIAIKKVLKRFEDKHRRALLVMATGTGKTRTAISLVDILTREGWAKRVLFLADQNTLVRQAKKNFLKHLPDNSSLVNLVESKDDDTARIVFSTYHTILNKIDDAKQSDDSVRRFTPGHFDLIIVDEAHRSIFKKFGAIFEYFDSMLLGLTATPKDELDRNTFEIFDIQDNVPTHAYSLDEGIREKHLVPYKLLEVPMQFHTQGIRYSQLSEEEKEAYEEKFLDEESGELPDHINPTELNEWIFNKNTTYQVLEHLMTMGQKVENGDRIGKTIIFAKNKEHAKHIQTCFETLYPHLGGNFCQVVTHEISHVESIIESFEDPDKEPHIASSVRMLDTGVDIEECLNLVFLKPVGSKAQFWQMVGRGTRTCKNIFGPGQNKELFYCFDYFGNFEFFDANPDGRTPSRQQKSVTQKSFEKRLAIIEHLQKSEDSNDKNILNNLKEMLNKQVKELDFDNFVNRKSRKYIEKFQKDEIWNNLTNSDVAELISYVGELITPEGKDDRARMFDLLILNIQESILRTQTCSPRNWDKLNKIAKALNKKRNVPAIAAKIEFINQIIEAEQPTDIAISDYEIIRSELRDLYKLLENEDGQDDVYINFKDLTLDIKESFYPVQHDLKLEDYENRIKEIFEENCRNLSFFKLTNGIQLDDHDLKELQQIIFDDKYTLGELKNLYGEKKPLLTFVRHIVGLDQKAVENAFKRIIGNISLNDKQTLFIQKLIKHVSQNGIMDIGDLYESPFVDIHNESIDGLFDEILANGLINTIRDLNKSAEVDLAA